MGILDIFKKNKTKPRKPNNHKNKPVSHKPKTKLCKVCKRRIRVRVVIKKEMEFIKLLKSNEPNVGYNQFPKIQK